MTPRKTERLLKAGKKDKPKTLHKLPDKTVVKDSQGDTGIINGDKIDYPETMPMTLTYAERYAPFTVLTRVKD